MAEYIDRELFVTDMQKRFCEDCDRRKGKKNGRVRFVYDIGDAPCRACWVDDAICEVEDYPSADVQPVVHGHWTRAVGVFVYGIDRDALGSYRCSACKNCSPHMTNYCPICGADMRGESDG